MNTITEHQMWNLFSDGKVGSSRVLAVDERLSTLSADEIPQQYRRIVREYLLMRWITTDTDSYLPRAKEIERLLDDVSALVADEDELDALHP